MFSKETCQKFRFPDLKIKTANYQVILLKNTSLA